MSIVSHRFVILLVEDEPADVGLVRQALIEDQVPADLHVVDDGLEALAFLRREGPQFAAAPRPDLVLLDLSLPRLDGRGCLAAMKKDSALRGIPVVMLTTSDSDRDIAASYQTGAVGYLLKSVDVRLFMADISKLCEYWITLMHVPQRP